MIFLPLELGAHGGGSETKNVALTDFYPRLVGVRNQFWLVFLVDIHAHVPLHEPLPLLLRHHQAHLPLFYNVHSLRSSFKVCLLARAPSVVRVLWLARQARSQRLLLVLVAQATNLNVGVNIFLVSFERILVLWQVWILPARMQSYTSILQQSWLARGGSNDKVLRRFLVLNKHQLGLQLHLHSLVVLHLNHEFLLRSGWGEGL